jgi:2-methylcitrate dehydratase
MRAYLAVVYTQTAIVAATAVADEVTMGAPGKAAALGRIGSIEIVTSKRGLLQTGTDRGKWALATCDTADHSMPYITARAMFDGDITKRSCRRFRSRKIRSSLHASAMPCQHASPRFLADGQRVSREIDDIPGFAGKPMQRPDIDRKFRGNIGKRWRRRKNDAVVQSL